MISRDLFLSLWVVIFTLLGIYLLGKIKFAHDSELPHIGVPRFMVALTSLSFALYLFTGLLGNELKGLSSILPPVQEKISANLTGRQTGSATSLCNTPKYANFLTLPYGLQGYFSYEEALTCARQQNKPVLVDFVGHTCSNCKKMYSEVWSDPRVMQVLQEEFIIVALYTDDKTKLPEADWFTSKTDGKIKNTIGKKNQDLQITRFGSNALPLYAIVDKDGKDMSLEYYTYNPNVEKFLQWLNKGIR
jgi:thiol:disulfide interchange protein DsbD